MSTTIELSKPLPTTKGGQVSALTFREPLYEDYLLLGDPRLPVIVNDSVVLQKLPEVIGKYAERLVEGNVVSTMIARLPLLDGLKVERAILGFFAAADGARVSDNPAVVPGADA